jgi:predicted methyltransferase
VVVDFGSGVGYFALKLSSLLGKNGVVVAEDIRQKSLVLLRIRAFLRDQHNLKTIRGETDDPRLPAGFADAVLTANTYHELTTPKLILHHLADSLKPGGRLVIVDRSPRSGAVESRETQAEHHELRPDLVETEVRSAGFEILSRQDHFIDRPADDQVWWLIGTCKLETIRQAWKPATCQGRRARRQPQFGFLRGAGSGNDRSGARGQGPSCAAGCVGDGADESTGV